MFNFLKKNIFVFVLFLVLAGIIPSFFAQATEVARDPTIAETITLHLATTDIRTPTSGGGWYSFWCFLKGLIGLGCVPIPQTVVVETKSISAPQPQ